MCLAGAFDGEGPCIRLVILKAIELISNKVVEVTRAAQLDVSASTTFHSDLRHSRLVTMRLFAAAALAVCLRLVTCHNILLKAHSRECFHEELHKDDKMTVTFQVGDREYGGSGNLDIDFYVRK